MQFVVLLSGKLQFSLLRIVLLFTDHVLFDVQGLDWYAHEMKVDEDGDVAHEFLSEKGAGKVATEPANLVTGGIKDGNVIVVTQRS